MLRLVVNQTSCNIALVDNWLPLSIMLNVLLKNRSLMVSLKFRYNSLFENILNIYISNTCSLYTTYFYTLLYIFRELKRGRRWAAVLSVQAVPHSTVSPQWTALPTTTTPLTHQPSTQLTVVSWFSDNYPPGFLAKPHTVHVSIKVENVFFA